MSTASTTCGSSRVVGTGPVWPPPSPPCTMTASTPQAATFSACRRAPIEGTTTSAGVLAAARSAPAWAPARTRPPSPARGSAASIRRSMSGCVGAQVDAERVGRCAAWTSAIALGELVVAQRGAGEDAQPAGAARWRRSAGRRRRSPCRSARSGSGRRTARRPGCAARTAAPPGPTVTPPPPGPAGRAGRAPRGSAAAPRRWAAGSRAPRARRGSGKPVAACTSVDG